MRLILTSESGERVQASLIGTFTPEDTEHRGDEPTFHAMAKAVFDFEPAASRVALVYTDSGQMMFLKEVAHRWFDLRANPVTVKRLEGAR